VALEVEQSQQNMDWIGNSHCCGLGRSKKGEEEQKNLLNAKYARK
jgi:hypothetical protein